jgi:catechol 2,3-dioxygenase-like lactoylglutathione lyase family enzyme
MSISRLTQPTRLFQNGNSVRTCFMIFTIAVGIVSSAPTAAFANPAGQVTGIGGVIVVSKNPRALAAWYRDVLGMSLESWGGAMFRYNAPGHPPYTVWSSFSNGAKEFAHAHRDFMLNLSVDDLDRLCIRLKAKGVPIYERESSAYGKFASIVDPDGTKIELWQAPKR